MTSSGPDDPTAVASMGGGITDPGAPASGGGEGPSQQRGAHRPLETPTVSIDESDAPVGLFEPSPASPALLDEEALALAQVEAEIAAMTEPATTAAAPLDQHDDPVNVMAPPPTGTTSNDEDPIKDGEGGGDGVEETEHATIAEVTESHNPADTKEENLADVIIKIKAMMACELVEVLESGEILVLPKGWSTRASKTHGGKKYFVSPYGQTQWLRPPMKTGIGYKWNHEIEVTFGPGRLGLNLKQISAEPGAEFSDILVHIAEIYKLGSGLASPAEIYNWSVKPEKRLQVGMRMTAINGVPLTGCTYNDVLDRVNRLPRPLRIKFADISKGIVGRTKEQPPEEETEEMKEARLNRARQIDLRLEYLQVLVAHELHIQVWDISKSRVWRKQQEVQRKEEILNTQIEAMHEFQELLKKESESYTLETANLQHLIEQLKLQEAGAIVSPEVTKAVELQERNAALDKEIKDLIAENESLRQERVTIEESLDAVNKELDDFGEFGESGGFDFFSPNFLGTLVERGSVDRSAENAREQLLERIKQRREMLENEITEEEWRVQDADTGILQFKRQMANADAASRREDELISGEKPPQLISLETKIEGMRKDLHATVTAMAAAAKEGNQARVDNLSIRRSSLKDEIKKALDEVQKFELEFNVRSSIDRRATVDDPISRESSARRMSQPQSLSTWMNEPDTGLSTRGLDAAEVAALQQEAEAPVDDKSPELEALEKKVETLRKDLHVTVARMAAAAKEGNNATVDNLSIRRAGIKEDLKAALDELQNYELAYGVHSSVERRMTADKPVSPDPPTATAHRVSATSSSVTRETLTIDTLSDSQKLQSKLVALRADLHETVAQIAKASSANDPKLLKEMSNRRMQLKEEIKVIQDEYQQLTRESLALPSPGLPPAVPVPSPPVRNSLSTAARTSLDRVSLDRPPTADTRERSHSRSSTSTNASRASVARSVDSSSNMPRSTGRPSMASSHSLQPMGPASAPGSVMPVLEGVLMKHPSHSNERSVFGNMSLRGVRERYCVLNGALTYYKRKGDREPRGSVPLDNPTLEVVYSKTELKSTEFAICTPTHQNKFVAKTREEMLQWVQALEATHALWMRRRRQQEATTSTPTSTTRRPSVDAPGLTSPAQPPPQQHQQQHRATLGF